jgi:hypothetical protein
MTNKDDSRARDDTGRPMLKFKDMDDKPEPRAGDRKVKKEDKYRSLYNPRKSSEERFKPAQIKQAADFIKRFASPETREFLSGSQFGNDPIFLQAVLDTIERARATTPEPSPLSYPDHKLDDLKSRGHEIREYLEQAVYEAQNKWIEEHGAIQDGLHPLDDFSEFTEGLDDNE